MYDCKNCPEFFDDGITWMNLEATRDKLDEVKLLLRHLDEAQG
jgi:uncharacterized protein YerC